MSFGFGERYEIVDERCKTTIYSREVARNSADCGENVVRRIDLSTRLRLWQYISLPRGGEPRRRVPWEPDTARRTARPCALGGGGGGSHLQGMFSDALEPVQGLSELVPVFQDIAQLGWNPIGVSRPDGPPAPWPLGVAWTESSILAQDERWRRA